jgi:PAS domain S-box-containing protein
MSESPLQRAGPIGEQEAFQQLAAALQRWLLENLGAENVRFYVWDRALAHSLPVWDAPAERDLEAGFDRALASLVDLALVTGEAHVLDPLKKDPVLGPLAPGHLSSILVLPYNAAAKPLGALVIFNARQQSLDSHKRALDLLATPTLMALRSFSELRHVALQNQQLQKNNENLTSLLKEVEQRRFAIERLTQELERTKGHLTGILENAAVGLISVDQSGKVRSANEPAAALFACSKESIIRRSIVDLVPRELQDEIGRLLQRTLSGETVRDLETAWPGTDGPRTINVTFSPLRSHRGEILGGVGIIENITERKQAEEALERTAKEQQALNLIAKAISQSLRCDELLEIALEKVLEITGRERGTIRLKDPVTGEVALSADRGFSQDEIGTLRANVPHQISEQVFASGQPVVVNDRADLSNSQSLLPQSRSVAWVPIKSRQKVIGVLGVSASRPIPFSEHEADLLQAVGNVIGVAVENAWLFEESQRQEEIQRLLKELSQDITALDIDALFQKVIDKVREFFKVDISDIRLLGENRLEPPVGSSGIASDRLYKLGGRRLTGRSKWILRNRRPLVIADTTKDEAIPSGDSVREVGIRGYLAVPLFSRSGEVIGILRALTYEPREFRPPEVDLLQQLANGTAIALANARLFEETEQRAHEQAVLSAVAMATSQSLRLDELLQIALDKVLEVTGREQGYIRLKDTLTGNLTLAAHRGISENFVEALLHQRTPGGKSDQVFESGEPLVVNDPETSPLKEQTRREGGRAFVWIPLIVRGRAVGIMNVSTTRHLPFQPREVELLKAIGNVIGVALENARLFQETERSLERIRALREIDQAITSSLDLHTVLEVLMEKIELVLPYAAATVRLFDPGSGLLEPVACRNLDEGEWKEAQWRGGRGIANVVFERKAPLIIRNAQADARVLDPTFYRKHKLTSYVGVPLRVKDQILGVLGFYTKEEHEFTGEEVEFLMTLAGQAAVAIHNARLHEETERRRREAEELARVAQSLTETLDMAAVGERIVTSMRELFGVRASMLRLLQADGSLRAIASSGQGFLQGSGGDVLPVGMGLAGRAVAEGRPIWSADVLNDPETHLTDQMRDYQVRSGNRSMIAVPLRAHERIVGSLGLSDQTGRVYSNSEVALVQTFADQAALALENARLYKEAQIRETQLQETNRMISALHAVAAAASQSLDLDRVLRAAIEKITEIFRFDATQIHIYNERTNELLLRAYFETDPNHFASVQSFRRGQGIVGKVAESGRPLIFEDVRIDPLYQRLSQTKISGRLNHHFLAVFPIRGKLKNLGTLACNSVDPRKLNSGEIQLLEAMADQIAVAIENSELYGQVRQKVQELQQKTEELERANKVKDEFLSVMSHELRTPLNVVMGYTAMIKDKLLGEVNPEQSQVLEKLMSRVRSQLNMVTSMLQATQIQAETVTVEHEEVQLKDLLDGLQSDYAANPSKSLTLVWDYPGDMPPIWSDGKKLKQILENLIHNAIKFTDQGHVTVSARLTESSKQNAVSSGKEAEILLTADCRLPTGRQWLELRVEDTGQGISTDALPIIFEKFRQADSSETRLYDGMGLGLYIAKNFIELLGGKIEVETGEGRGSVFTVSIPCAASASTVERGEPPAPGISGGQGGANDSSSAIRSRVRSA